MMVSVCGGGGRDAVEGKGGYYALQAVMVGRWHGLIWAVFLLREGKREGRKERLN